MAFDHNAPWWRVPFPTRISGATGQIYKTQTALDSPLKTVEEIIILLASRSLMTPQVLSSKKYLWYFVYCTISWISMDHNIVEFVCYVHWVVWNNFQHSIIKVRSRLGQKGQISNLINVNKKGIYQMQFEHRNPMVPFILLYNARYMLKYAFQL